MYIYIYVCMYIYIYDLCIDILWHTMSIDTILHDIAIYHLLEVSCITDITVALSWERSENAKSYTSKLPEQTSMGPLSLGGHPVPISMHSKPWPRRWRVCRDWCAVHPRESARDLGKVATERVSRISLLTLLLECEYNFAIRFTQAIYIVFLL